MYKRLHLIALGSIASFILAGCGGSDPQTDGNNNPQLTETQVEAKILKSASAGELETHLKNGMRLTQSQQDTAGLRFDDSITADTTSESFQDSVSSSDFSITNTHVHGVDEADFVKYDGRYMFLRTPPQYVWAQEQPAPEIRIMETDPDNAGITQIASIPMTNEGWGEVSELYLTLDENDTAASITSLRNTYNIATITDIGRTQITDGIIEQPSIDKIVLTSYALDNPSQPEKSFSLEIDGFLYGSRKIDDTVYLITQYSPFSTYSTLEWNDVSNTDQSNNDERLGGIDALTLTDLLPKVRINDGDQQALVSAEDCYIPVDLSAQQGYSNIITLIAINLANQSIVSSKCLNTQVNGIYSSEDSLYLGGSSHRAWQQSTSFTVLHKFTLGDTIEYRSTGIVPGTLGWSDPAFRMDEHEDQLRVVTTERDESADPIHRLSILEDVDNSDEMRLVSQLPNAVNSAPIGKPLEDIFAVRFMGERAYIVTFERIDPLYVIDLSQPEMPVIAGELEVPGFANYLHPIGENYLLGVGYDADQNGAQTGVKTSLYDISDIQAPQLINSINIGDRGSWTPAAFDLRSMSFLQTSADQLKFTLPASRYQNSRWQDDALYLYEVNGLASDAANLHEVGKVISEASSATQSWPSIFGMDRSVLDTDALYYIHGKDIWSAFWSSPEAATGPH